MTDDNQLVTNKTLLRFWLPLEATWLMMALEGPFLAALIARLPDPKYNLAAYGVITALAWIVESPVILMLSASNALVRDRLAFLKLRRFATALNAAVTIIMLLLVTPPVFRLVVRRWIGLPPDVARLAARAMILLILWPAAIGFRRFYQGILIRQGHPRAVAIGTVIRLTTMAATGIWLAFGLGLSGSSVGAGALGAGVIGEAVASWLMARRSVHRLLEQPEEACAFGRGLTMGAIGRFYTPMALMAFLALAIHPLTTFFMGRSRQPLESLAVVPVIAALVFLFRTPGIAYQEVVIALLGDRFENRPRLRRLGLTVGSLSTVALTAVAFSPLAKIWLQDISGLSPDLARFALVPIRILVLLPAIEVIISLLRGLLVKAGRTWPLVGGVTGQIVAVLGTLWIAVGPLRMVGATAAGLAQLAGYAAGLLVLVGASRRAVLDYSPGKDGTSPPAPAEAVRETLSCP